MYWMGETVLRLPTKLLARYGGQYQYSRYDCVMELEAIRHFLRHHNSVYHFVYAEKSYRLMANFAGKNGNKLIGTFHHPIEHIDRMFRSVAPYRKLDCAIVVSRNQLAYWESVLGKGRVRYVPYAVDINYFTPSAGTNVNRAPRCIFIGNHERDFDCLSKVVAGLVGTHPAVEFLMISGDDRCGQIAQANPRTIWHKRVGDDEYLSLLQNSDILVLPLRTSTTNTAVLEAMACGVPVVTTVGGIEDYLSPGSSLVVPAGDSDTMTRGVLGLLKDSARLREMATDARTTACRFSWERTAEKMVEVYESIARGE
jgi:glycosyltransferase involved in cell wall biosynthesis